VDRKAVNQNLTAIDKPTHNISSGTKSHVFVTVHYRHLESGVD
jgi:hypothetical protein